MAPELIARKPASIQSDVYSLGVLLYQLIVGDLLRPITTDWSKDLDNSGLREDLARCTARNPNERFASASELANNLRALEKRQTERALQEALRRAEEEARQRQMVEEHNRQLEAAYAKVSETVTRLQLQRAEELFAAGDSDTALAYLARLLRKDPNNRVAAARLLSDLGLREIAFPITPPLQHKDQVHSAEFSPDGQSIVTASGDRTARVWDARMAEPKILLLRHQEGGGFAQFSPDGRCIATASTDKTVRIYEARTGRLVSGPFHDEEYPVSVLFSPDSERVVVARTAFFPSGHARVWDVKSGQPITPPLKHLGGLSSAVFSPDGRGVLMASWDFTAQLWDAQTGAPIGPPLSHENLSVWAARFSPAGQRIVTGCGKSANV
ncbi:MAG: tetratricopeptide repeat protein [Verrucomicrobia bacterium]|nr:tetratricopeptide repeat protein [Verrucomicrobiota bacterium]